MSVEADGGGALYILVLTCDLTSVEAHILTISLRHTNSFVEAYKLFSIVRAFFYISFYISRLSFLSSILTIRSRNRQTRSSEKIVRQDRQKRSCDRSKTVSWVDGIVCLHVRFSTVAFVYNSFLFWFSVFWIGVLSFELVFYRLDIRLKSHAGFSVWSSEFSLRTFRCVTRNCDCDKECRCRKMWMSQRVDVK